MPILPDAGIPTYTGKGMGGIDITDFIDKLKQIVPNIEQAEIFPKAIRAAAQVFVAPIEAATTIRWENLLPPATKYKTATHTKYHPPGQAKKNVIVYKRKRPASYFQGDVNASVSYLVGYEKRMAFYMYWNEYGRKGQPARPVVRPAFDAHNQEAMDVALAYIKRKMEE